MPLLPIERQWDIGSRLEPLVLHVAKVLRMVGGAALYRRSCSRTFVARVRWYESFGQYPWRVYLREAYALSDEWRDVAQYPTFRQAEAEAKRLTRRNALAVADGDAWVST